MQKKPRSWQRMLSGRRLDLLNPSPLDIEIEDIARGISRVARWNGQTSGGYPLSVAQHSVIVAELLKIYNPDHILGVGTAALRNSLDGKKFSKLSLTVFIIFILESIPIFINVTSKSSAIAFSCASIKFFGMFKTL